MTWQEIFFSKIVDLFLTEKAITVPSDFHEQCRQIEEMLENDVTGLITPLINYAIESASEANYKIECETETLDTLNDWLNNINIALVGKTPVGIKELAKEYFKERWFQSSLCLLRVQGWKEHSLNGTKILLPQALYFVNGSSIYVKAPKAENFKLGSHQYFLDRAMQVEDLVPKSEKENIIVQKPFERWYADYPTPYLVKNGVLKNFKFIELLQDKGDEVLTKVLPYLLMVKRIIKDIGGEISDDRDMAELQNRFDTAIKKYKKEKGKTPVFAAPDTELSHVIPDLSKILSDTLFYQANRQILGGIGFIDVVQGLSSIDKDEFVLCKRNKELIMPRIKELEGITDLIEVPTYDKGKLIWKKANIWYHHYNGKMYNIISDDGQLRVKTTGNHSIMIWDIKKGLISKRADEIKEGELILTVNNFNQINNKYKYLSFQNTLGTNQFKKYNKISTIKVDEDFGYFLGWYLAEGYCGNNDSIILSIGLDKIIAEKILEIGEKVLNKKGRIFSSIKKGYKHPVWMVQFYGRGLSILFKSICKYGAKNKQVPNVIFNSPKSVQKTFLDGLLEGDGHYYKDKNVWELTTASEELAYGTITLARMLGYYPHFNMRKRNFICKNIFEKRTYYLIYLAKEQGILRELIPNFKTRQQGYITNLNDIINNYNNLPKDWSIKRIKSIITYDYDDLVYDMTVKDNPTFVAGTNILVHNSTRRESVMNPKPFISSINSGVSDFKAIILDLMRLIYNKNKEGHPKLFTDINKLTVASSPLKINIEQILDQVRSGFVYGTVSIPTYQEALGLDPETERQRMQKEWDKGYRELFYPHLIQNREDIPDPNLDVKVPPLTKKQVEKQNEKTKQPKHMMKAEYTDDDFEFATLITCPKCNQEYIFEDLREAGMGYCKCPNCNEVLTQDLCEKARIDVTKNYIRIRQRELNEFESNSFRIIILSKDQGIKAVIGRLKGETTTTVQSYLFLKEKWSKEDAIKWVKEHGGKAVADVENNLIVAPYQNVEELLQKHPSMKKYPTEALKVFIEVFNKSLPKGEDYAYPVAWAAMKRWLKKHGYKKANNEWVKE